MGHVISGHDTVTGQGVAKRTLAGPAIVIVVLTLLAFWPVRHNGFVLIDDQEYITNNTVVKRGLTVQGLVLAFTKSYAANWHPLTWVSHMLDVEIFGLDPGAHHLVGLALHVVTALLFLAALRALTGRTTAALLVAALFAVHPLHVESVAWASERKDLLCAFFWASALGAYLWYARGPRVGRYLVVLLLFALALMAKPMAVTLPLVLLLLDYWPLGRLRGAATAPRAPWRPPVGVLLEKVPLLALSLLSGLVTLKAQRGGGAVISLQSLSLAQRASNALASAVGYLGKTVLPTDLAVFYPLASTGLVDLSVLAAGALLVAASVAVWLLRRRSPWLLTGWLWYLITIVPVIGLIQVGEQAMADRYTYLPLIGIFIAGSWAIERLLLRRSAAGQALRVGTLVALLLLVALTRRQTAVWRDDETLFAHAVRVTTGNWKATYLLGTARELAGDREGAMRLYREAIRIKPDFSKARYAYALELDEEGRTLEAIGELREAVKAQPADPVIRMVLALFLEREGLEEEAIGNLQELIRIRPEIAEGYNNLAVLLARRGDGVAAAALLRRALAIEPAYEDARRNLEMLTGGPSPGGEPPADSADIPTTHRRLLGIDLRRPPPR